MFEVPHMLTGAAIGRVWPRARYALPAAFLSHFVLDAIPHREVTEIPGISKRALPVLEALGLVGALALVVGLCWRWPQRWVMWGAGACAIVIDLLDFVHPVCDWWHGLSFTPPLSYLHAVIQKPSRSCPLSWGLAGQALVIALATWVLLLPDGEKG